MESYRGAGHAVIARLRRHTGTLPSPPTIEISDSMPPRASTLLQEATCGSLPTRPAAATTEVVHVAAPTVLQGARDWTEKALHVDADIIAHDSNPKKERHVIPLAIAWAVLPFCPRESRFRVQRDFWIFFPAGTVFCHMSVTCLSHGKTSQLRTHGEGRGSRHTLTTTMSEAVHRSWTILPEADSVDSPTSWCHESASPSGRRGQQPPKLSKQGGGGSPRFHSPPKVVNVSVSDV